MEEKNRISILCNLFNFTDVNLSVDWRTIVNFSNIGESSCLNQHYLKIFSEYCINFLAT